MYSRPCLAGEEQTVQGTCNKCLRGFYLINAPDRVFSCKQCPQNAECFGGNGIAPRAGSYRTDLLANETLDCLNPAACQAGSENALEGTCTTGYRGMLCGSCQDNYYKSSWLRCDLCETQNKLIIYAFLRVLWLIVVIMSMVQLNLANAKRESKQYSAFLQQIKLMVNHCVVMAAILSIDYKWEPLVPTSGAQGEEQAITIR